MEDTVKIKRYRRRIPDPGCFTCHGRGTIPITLPGATEAVARLCGCIRLRTVSPRVAAEIDNLQDVIKNSVNDSGSL